MLLLLLSLITAQSGSPPPSTPSAQRADSSRPTANGRELPAQTSRYNRGGFPGRYRDAKGKVRLFTLKYEVSVFDGAGNAIGRARKPVMLNQGVTKQMEIDGKDGPETYVWGWRTDGGSGWVPRDALADPPPLPPAADLQNRNPRPPRESPTPLTIDAAAGRKQLAGLRHVNTQGVIPRSGGNKGEHYAGRNPGPKDFVYLLLAVPNVQRGGMAKDSIPNGGKFLPALDEKGKPIQEVMTMYRGRDLTKPVPVTLLYGRAPGSDRYGWIARANVGAL